MRRTERLFAMAEYLRGRRTGVTAEALAERFQVTVRTIYRDLDALRDASLPLSAERGPGGGYALDKSYTLPPVNFNAREAALLVALGNFAMESRLMPFLETLRGSLEKVRAALSASAQRDLLAQLEELSFQAVPALPVRPAVRAAVERAWFERTPLEITYVNADFVERRYLVRIQAVVMSRHETRIEVRSCDPLDGGAPRDALHRFRLDRIVRAVVHTTEPTETNLSAPCTKSQTL